ncbi:MAG: hypothetical protein RQ968_02965 [Thermoproteota archaeon]|jgi:molybdopterin converting factor small subunit|nr:hypothetical protein [Thermoproteota archaeon]
MQASYSNEEIGRIKVKLLGVLKGLAKKEELELQISSEEISLFDLLRQLTKLNNNEEFLKRIFNPLLTQISPDILISYENKIYPARGNENMKIKRNSELTIFSFVHGG